MATEKSFVGEGVEDLLGNKRIRFMAEFLDDLVRGSGVEYVVLHWYILVVKLIQKAQRRYVLSLGAIPDLAEFLSNVLSIRLVDSLSFEKNTCLQSLNVINSSTFELDITITVNNSVDIVVG